MQGNYQGTAPFLISPVQGIQTYVKYVNYSHHFLFAHSSPLPKECQLHQRLRQRGMCQHSWLWSSQDSCQCG